MSFDHPNLSVSLYHYVEVELQANPSSEFAASLSKALFSGFVSDASMFKIGQLIMNELSLSLPHLLVWTEAAVSANQPFLLGVASSAELNHHGIFLTSHARKWLLDHNPELHMKLLEFPCIMFSKPQAIEADEVFTVYTATRNALVVICPGDKSTYDHLRIIGAGWDSLGGSLATVKFAGCHNKVLSPRGIHMNLAEYYPMGLLKAHGETYQFSPVGAKILLDYAVSRGLTIYPPDPRAEGDSWVSDKIGTSPDKIKASSLGRLQELQAYYFLIEHPEIGLKLDNCPMIPKFLYEHKEHYIVPTPAQISHFFAKICGTKPYVETTHQLVMTLVNQTWVIEGYTVTDSSLYRAFKWFIGYLGLTDECLAF